MPGNQKRRQQALQRQAAKRKQKQQALRRQQQGTPTSPRGMVRRAAHWPIYECLISRDWQSTDNITQIVVARGSPEGHIAAGVFLVDLACLGVKDAFAHVFDSITAYDELRESIKSQQPLVRADLDLVAKVIREALAFARRFGFSPHPDYYSAAPLLEGANPDAATTSVPQGKDGKPFFVAGPHDNVPRILAQLAKSAGPGNFDSVVPLDMPPDVFDGEEEDDDADEEDEQDEDELGDDEEGVQAGSEAGESAPPRPPIWSRLLPVDRKS
jgi:hypothetical protein